MFLFSVSVLDFLNDFTLLNEVEMLYYSMILTAFFWSFQFSLFYFFFKKHATFTCRLRSKFISTHTSDSLGYRIISNIGDIPDI